MAVQIPYVREIEFEYGDCDELSPLIRRVVAHNPSAFTYKGTGTYIVGHGEVAVIDPGPLLDAHLDALLRALAGESHAGLRRRARISCRRLLPPAHLHDRSSGPSHAVHRHRSPRR